MSRSMSFLGMFVVCLASSVVAQSVRAEAGEIDSSVMLIGDWDSTRDESGNSRCHEMVEMAARLGNRTVSFVPTHYAYNAYRRDAKGNVLTDRYGRPTWQAEGYCFRTGSGECRPFSADSQAPYGHQWRIKNDWAACFAHALDLGMDLSFLPHLDDGHRVGAWRNNMALAADQRIGSDAHSYKEIMLDPLAIAAVEAIKASGRRDARIYFALQGEMGAPIFYDPAGFRRAAIDLRKKFAEVERTHGTRVQMGISLNFNAVSGGIDNTDRTALRALFRAVDFVGLSSYGWLDVWPTAANFDRTVDSFAEELLEFGIDLASLVREQGKHLHFSELGIGGGADSSGRKIASELWEYAAYPYYGIFGSFDPDLNPWASDNGRAFQREFYRAAVDFASRPVEPWRVGFGYWLIDKAFLWSLSSWDVQAIYPSTQNAFGSYRNERVMCLLYHHNLGWQGEGCLADPPRDVSVATCSDARSEDHDGDGYGWNGYELCRVRCRHPERASGGYGWEDGRTCVTEV